MKTCTLHLTGLRRVILAAAVSTAWTPMAMAQESALPITYVPAVVNTCGLVCDASGLQDLADYLARLTVVTGSNEGQVNIRVRGIGTIGDNAGLDPSVGLFVDGVYRPRSGMGMGPMDDVDRIELITGPDTVRFGRNSLAGAINVTTRSIGSEPRFSVRLGGGNYDSWRLGVSGETWLGQNAAIRLTGTLSTRDGFTAMNLGGGPRTAGRDGNVNSFALRGRIQLQPSNNFTATLDLDLAHTRGDCCAAVTLVRGPTAPTVDALAPDAGIAPVADPFARVAWGNRSTAQAIDDQGAALKLEWDTGWMGDAWLTSLTAVRGWDARAGSDLDHTSADMAYRLSDNSGDRTRITSFSQDLQIDGGGDNFSWLVGASWSRETLKRTESTWIGSAYEPFLAITVLSRINPLLASSPTAPLFLSQASGRPFGTVFAGQASDDRYEQRYDSFSLYTDNTWKLGDRFELRATFRYAWDDKRLASDYANPNGGLGCAAMLANPAQVVAALVARGLTVAQASVAAPQVVGFACQPTTNVRHDGRSSLQTLDNGGWSGSLTATLKLGDRHRVYAAVARGYKSGGFNLDRVQSNTGLSSGTAGVVPVTDTSFGSETVQSYEAGVNLAWNGGKIRFDAAVFHQRHDDFQIQAVGTLGSFVRTVPQLTVTGFDVNFAYRSGDFWLRGGVVYADAKYGNDALLGTELLNLPGSRPSLAPEWSLTGAMGYAFAVGGNRQVRPEVGVKYVSSYNASTALNPLAVQSGYALIDARVAFGPSDRSWSIELWGRNLGDAEYVTQAFEAPNQFGTIDGWLGAPRTYGATVRFSY